VIGYILLAVAFMTLIGGLYATFSEVMGSDAQSAIAHSNGTEQSFSGLVMIGMVMTPLIFWLEWFSDKFVRHS